jgi:hypothetical protein
LRRQSEYNADKGKGYDSTCQGRKKRVASKQIIWSQHTTTREERQPFRFKKRGREEERKRGREEERKRGREEERKRGREEERKRGREEERKRGNDWICEGRKQIGSKHGVWSQYTATNNKRRKTTVLI